jgi:hypothetical protein
MSKISIEQEVLQDHKVAQPREPENRLKYPKLWKLRSYDKMEFISNKYNANVFNDFGTSKQDALTIFNRPSPRISKRFTVVEALGKVRNYSRIELLTSFFRGV